MIELTLLDVLKILFKKLWLIIIVTILCGAVAFTYSTMFVDPTYTASARLVATNGGIFNDSEDNDTVKSNDVQTSVNLMETFVNILGTNKFSGELSDKLAADYPDRQFNYSGISATYVENTFIIAISVNSDNSDEAVIVANEVINLATEYLESNIPNSYARVIDESSVASKTGPATTSTSIIAAFVGFVITCLIVIVIALLDQTVKGEEDFTKHYDIPILGTVPDFEAVPKGNYKKGGYEYGYGYRNK